MSFCAYSQNIMDRFFTGIYRFLRGMMTFIALACFMGLSTIHTLTGPNESPRSVMMRLSGIDIAPKINTPDLMNHAHDQNHGLHHKAYQQHQKSHHEGMTCPLCPLLVVSMAVLGAVMMVVAFTFVVKGYRRYACPLRGPPKAPFFLRPFPRGPPLFYPV